MTSKICPPLLKPVARSFSSSPAYPLAGNLAHKGGGGEFVPTQIADMQAWWDVSDADTITLSTALVDGVADKSGNSNDLSSTTTNRPSYVADDGDGLPAIDSNNKILESTNTISSVSAETIFFVVRVENALNTLEPILGSSSAGLWRFVYSNSTTPFNILWSTTGTTKGTQALRDILDVNSGATYGKFKILRLRRSQAKDFIEAYENGMLMGRDKHSSGTLDMSLDVGGYTTSRGILSWRECLWYDRDLTDAEVAQVEAYLNTKWNVYSVPTALSAFSDWVKRAAIAKGYTVAADFTSLATFWRLIGDSTGVGWPNKSDFTAAYVKLFTDAYIYNLTGSPTTTTNFEILDSRDAATRNDRGNTQSTMGMNPVISELNGAATSLVDYNLKDAVNGTKASTEWLVASGKYPSGTKAQDIQQYNQEALDEVVFVDDICVTDYGTVISLGPNDMDVADDYNNFETNYGNLVDYLYNIMQGRVGRVYCCEVWSSASGRNTGSPSPNAIVRQAIVDVAAARGFATHIDGPDSDSDTIDTTHNNAATYEAQATAISGVMTA